MELDIYIPEINVGIEYDGVYWHRNKTNIIDREKRKYEICQNHNIKLIRIKEKINDDDFVRADFAISLPTNEAGYMALDHVIMILLQYIDPDCNMWTRKNSTHYWSDIKPNVERDRFEIMSYLSNPIKNSLEAVNPRVAKEWNYDKNGELKPNMVSAGSSLKVHWKCNNCGFEWEAQISSRTKENTGCPKCAGRILDIGINDLATKCPELLQDWDYVENDKIGIKPNEILYNSGQKVFWKCHTCGHVWSREINSRSIQKQGCIKCGYKNNVKTKKEKRIQKEGSIKNEKLLNEWDSELNFPHKPSEFPPSSGYKAHWICSKCGHKWIAPISLRIKGKRGCRKCADKANPQLLRQTRIKQGRAITNELLLKEWDYEQNYPKTPSDYSNGSGIKVAWICSKCGHKWHATIHSRNAGSGCPNCAGQVCISGKNDLKTKYPDIAKEWDYIKNKTINPENILPRSNKKYWWICPLGHESYESTPGHRIDGTGCPICARMKISDKSSVKVDQLTKDFVFIKTFNSAKEAERLTRISRSSISQAIRRKSLAGGFRWKHTDKV